MWWGVGRDDSRVHLTIHLVPGVSTILLGAHLLVGCVSRHPAKIHVYSIRF